MEHSNIIGPIFNDFLGSRFPIISNFSKSLINI